jgi:hypothetical protein
VAYAPSTTNSRKSKAITAITASTTLLLRPHATAAAALFNGKRNGQIRSSERTPNLPVGDYPESVHVIGADPAQTVTP